MSTAPSPGVFELMRMIDAYAYDYKKDGKLARSRIGVEMELNKALPNGSHGQFLTKLLVRARMAKDGTISPTEFATQCERMIQEHLDAMRTEQYFRIQDTQ